MGCECMECKFINVVRDNHEGLHPICVCQESENFLKEIELAFDSCDYGEIKE